MTTTHPTEAGPAADSPEATTSRSGLLATLAVALGWVVVAVLGLVVVAAVAVPRLTGAETYTILTGSMEPELVPGDVVVVRPTAPEDVSVGDVVTYQLQSGEGRTVTHRVVGLTVGPGGEGRLVTQGDANDVPDAETVRGVQVRGTVWYAVPLVGRAAAVLDADARNGLARLAALGLFAYAALVLLREVAARRRRRAEQ